MSKKANDALRNEYVAKMIEWLKASDEDVLQVSTNEIAIPVVDSEGEDNYVVFTIKVPVGDRDGNAYDAYERAQEFAMKQQEKAEKAAKDAERKTAKIARDEAMRKQKAEAKAKREGQ
jgi:hypothetical protein